MRHLTEPAERRAGDPTGVGPAQPAAPAHYCLLDDLDATPADSQIWCRCGRDWQLRDDGVVRVWLLIAGARGRQHLAIVARHGRRFVDLGIPSKHGLGWMTFL